MVYLGNFLDALPIQDFFVPPAKADEENEPNQEQAVEPNPVDNEAHNKLGIIAILAEKELISDFDVRARIMTYAENAQSRIPHSKAVVIEVAKNESTFKISSVLEKLYFEGVDTDQIDGSPLNNNSVPEDNNQLIGVVLIGEVPLPVVHDGDGNALPSLYPYTDFDRKQFIYNHQTDQFEKNSKVASPNPEVWHGVIQAPSKDPKEAKDQIITYLEKNNAYSKGEEAYTNFEQRVMYANFPEMEKQMNFVDYKNYDRYLKFMEEMTFKRFNKHLLKEFIADVSADLKSAEPIMNEDTINKMLDVYTETIFKKYATNLAESMRTYRSGLNEVIDKTGRWSDNQVDSPESLISLRDEYAKHEIHRTQLLLEKAVDDYVEENIPPDERAYEITTQALLNVKLKILEINADNRIFSFFSHIDGIPTTNIESMEQCGIQVGQKKNVSVSALENNSVLVNANRMYNPETLIVPPKDADKDWELKENSTYKRFAGCVFNNSVENAETGASPDKCVIEDSEDSLFDIEGSIEIPATEPAYSDISRCAAERMTFLLSNQAQFEEVAAGANILGYFVLEKLKKITEDAYVSLQGDLEGPSLKQKASYVVKKLLTSDNPLTYELFPGVEIELSAQKIGKKIDSMVPHVEPTNETIKAIKHIGEPRVDPVTGEIKFPQIITPSLPADGLRLLSFFNKGAKKSFEYLNLFRITGNTSGEITGDLLKKIEQKKKELDEQTGTESDLFESFFLEHSDVVEPLVWKASSVDQKLRDILPKYLDQGSFMPSPDYNPKQSPQNKPNGYEVLHIVAEGDSKGYQFGLNRAMLRQANLADAATQTTDTQEPDLEEGGQENQPSEEEQSVGSNYVCGDPAGVEIWEWFDALQCWIEEEIMPAQELFALSQMCTAAPLPPKETNEPTGDIFDQLLAKASNYEVDMKRRSLVLGQEETITISAFNSAGEPLLGYIDMPVHLELEDKSLGEFSANDFYIYAGSRNVTFTPQKTGVTKLTIQMGDLEERSFEVRVENEIKVNWFATEILTNGRNEFKINLSTQNGNGNDLVNINDTIILGPEQPADGGFINGGKVQFINGKAQTSFMPTPGRKEVKLISKDPYITSEPFIIKPTPAKAKSLVIRTPSYIPITQEATVQILAVDDFGALAESFEGIATLSFGEMSKGFASFSLDKVELVKGKGTVTIRAGKQTADVLIRAENSALETGEASVPLVARMESKDWEKTYPQNLVASFVGFPAGDVTQENSFGATQLMAGKTQAVYSFLSGPLPPTSLSIAPNHFIQTSQNNQSVLVEFPDHQMLLQAFDIQTMQTLISKKVDLNFNSVELFENQNLEPNNLYLEILDTEFAAIKQGTGYEIRDSVNQPVAQLETNKIHLTNSEYKWEYVYEPEFGVIELNLSDGASVVARILLNLEGSDLEADDFEEISPNLNWKKNFSGKSTSDPNGFTFFQAGAEVEEETRGEFYGLEGEHKYLSLFASGTNFGEAVKYNLPVTGIVLGDPTVKLATKSLSGLNYNSAIGEQIYQDSEGAQVVSINHFNFNNDGQEDIAVLLEDGRVRLLEGGPTEPAYRDKGNIAQLADGGVALEALDIETDGYEDLLVATEEGRLAILNNQNEVITRTDQKLNVGKKVLKLFKQDMDQDTYADLVILDSRGDIYIFYYNPDTESFPENGQWIANYGFSLNLGANLNADLDLRYPGIPEPSTGQVGINQSQVPLEEFEGGGQLSEQASLAFYEKLSQESEALAEDPGSVAETGIPKLPWPEDNESETYFEAIENLGFLSATKKVANADRPGEKNVDIQESLEYQIEITSNVALNNVVLADTVPDSLSFDASSVECVQGGCQSIQTTPNSVRIFFSRLNIVAGQTMIIRYKAMVSHTPEAALLIQKIDEPNENLGDPNSIVDPYYDLLVSPPYNNTGKLLLHYSTGPRSYQVTQSNEPEPQETEDAVGNFNDTMSHVADFQEGNVDSENPPPLRAKGLEEGLDEATGNNDCFEDAESSVGCAEQALDKVAKAISDFSCIGGGCFPMPFNQAFMVPPKMPFPVFAFPTTRTTPAGPMPFVWPGAFLGASNVTGPIFSSMRFYVSPTLTGGVGLAMCWGPYPKTQNVPPPTFPIPYPPPTGNCMVTAIPADALYGGLCSKIEDGISKVMDYISAGVNKIDSSITSINDNPNIPINTQAVGQNQSAGGLEISLATNLGGAMKFDPPVKAVSNIHLPAFDSIGGVIAGWVDRQLLEISNKLLTLPTFSIYLPDMKSLFALDFGRAEKSFTAWKNVMTGATGATFDSLSKIGDQETISNQELAEANANETDEEGQPVDDRTTGQKLRGGLTDLSGSKALKYTQAIETHQSIYNLNALEGLYDVANSLPLVRLTEKPIQFNVPWLGAAEIQAYILELQDWIIYYEQEYDRVKDKWEAISCNDQPDPTDAAGFMKNSTNCVGRKVADAFGASFDELIGSAKQNIEVLQSYLNFPKELVAFKQQLASYVGSISCYLDIIAKMMGGYMATIQQQMISWAEVVLTIVEVVKNIEQLFDVFTNFDSNCDTCTNERYANFGWWSLLGLILPEIPVIQFPKIPDIVFDLSNIDVLLDIELPVLAIRPEPIPLPPLPYISLPDFPNTSIFLNLPPLPVLPELPSLPELPALPPLPIVDLPTLPPPPKLPDVGKAFEVIMPLVEKILNVWCLMKKSFAPVPEMMLADQVRLLTNRPQYLIPLDLLKVQLPKIAPFDLGFNEVRIETVIYLGLRLNATSKPLEELSKTWNDWVKSIPETMNQSYGTYLEKTEGFVQGILDEAEEAVSGKFEEFEAGFEEYVQGWLDKNIGDPLTEADKWLQNKEAEWQDWADENNIDASYDEYFGAINNLYEKIRKSESAKVNEWFDKNREVIHALNYMLPVSALFELANEENLGEYLQEGLDFMAEKLNQVDSLGPTLLQRLYTCMRYYKECRVNQKNFFGDSGEQANAKEIETLPVAPQQIVQQNLIEENQQVAQQILSSPQGKEIGQLFGEMAGVINQVNQAEYVDYTVLKERFGVPDYQLRPRSTVVDKLRKMEEQLTEHSEKLLAEAEGLKYVKDLNAIAGVGPRNNSPYVFASNQIFPEEKSKTVTSAVEGQFTNKNEADADVEKQMVELQEKIERQAKGNENDQLDPVNNSSCEAAVCLPDPINNSPVPVVPSIDLIANSETLFMPNGHLIYSDGTALHLKRDLTFDDSDQNTDKGKPQRFSLVEMMNKLQMEEEPKESVNMLETVFAEDGAATFSWLPTSHPAVYGYGLELERTITGYDHGKQNNQTADTRIILLPVTEEGEVPEALVGDQPITFGTLVTSLTNQEEAIQKFGIQATTIITGAKEIHFPSIANAQINVDEWEAVYFDQLEGSAYSLAMENGFHHIKMTWFDKNARTATYNKNEILAPQAYADAAEPIDVSQQETYYMPIFKEKRLNASTFFADLSGGYQYYWFVDSEKNDLVAHVGEELVIEPQDELKRFKIKLVATRSISDRSFDRFEKEFTMQVYAPTIALDEENLAAGVIAGDMEPILQSGGDDLKGVPFSVFRKRNGTWKNLGLLHADDLSKLPTDPEIKEENYYSLAESGAYHVEGFDALNPSPIIFKNHEGKTVATVLTENGEIELAKEGYELVAVPASSESPTHIAITLKETGEILGNVYYIAETQENVRILDSGLTAANVNETGVTVGDANVGDGTIAALIPDNGPSYPGGVAIFNDSTQKNIALIDKDGAIRMMDGTYRLDIKNKDEEGGLYIFQIQTSEGNAVFDIFIQADWDNVAVDLETKMGGLEKQIGLGPSTEKAYAQMTPETTSSLPQIPSPIQTGSVEPTTTSPFPDLSPSHPFFKEILELYEARVVGGYADGTFKPDQKLTRAEFVKIALGVTNCFDCENPTDPQRERYNTNPFPDVSLPAWYFFCLSIAKELGMVTGYGDGLFRPDQNISRAEAAAILLRQSDIDLMKAPAGRYRDVLDSAWYVDYVHTAVQIGLIKENFGLVNPDEEITRGEFAFMASGLKDYRECRLVDEDDDGVPDWWEVLNNMDPLVADAERACPCFNNPNQTDTDKDGRQDKCDLDIDNDGILNPMCIFDDAGGVDKDLIEIGAQTLGEALDNCIFNPNADQKDYDNNGIGDTCDSTFVCPCVDNPNQNDSDEDGVRDVCDDDIDNDSVKNPICAFDDSGLLDGDKLVGGVDNCVFTQNPNQEDENENNIGDICEEGVDFCPKIPEDLDGVDDEDGCPEVNDTSPEKPTGTYASPGPLCGFIDYKSDLMPGDILMTAITDLESHEVIYSQSEELTYQ